MTEENPYCNCCSTIADHLDQHFDPAGHLRGDEEAIGLVIDYQEMCKADGEDDYPDVSVKDMESYLEHVRERHATA
jgi:hypothetical protein